MNAAVVRARSDGAHRVDIQGQTDGTGDTATIIRIAGDHEVPPAGDADHYRGGGRRVPMDRIERVRWRAFPVKEQSVR